jgi:hypothetical protein
MGEGGGREALHTVPPSPVTHLLCRSEVQYSTVQYID